MASKNKIDWKSWKSIANGRGQQIIDLGHEIKKLEAELAQCRADHQKACTRETTAKAQWDWHQKKLTAAQKDLEHQRRLVRTLTDALADKYHPLPTNINVPAILSLSELTFAVTVRVGI